MTLPIFPFVNQMKPIPGKLNEFEMEGGVYVEIFHVLQVFSYTIQHQNMIISILVVFHSKDLLNFTYTLTKPQEGNFGRLSKDGTWNGMIRLLQDRDVDIGLFCFFF